MYCILFFGFILAATSGHAVAREPYINGGHFSALNDEWQQEKIVAQTEAAMSPTDVASSNCDALSDDNSNMSPTDVAASNCDALSDDNSKK